MYTASKIIGVPLDILSSVHWKYLLQQGRDNTFFERISFQGFNNHLPALYRAVKYYEEDKLTSNSVLWPLLLTWFNFNPSMDK